jgi:hypothetical protein
MSEASLLSIIRSITSNGNTLSGKTDQKKSQANGFTSSTKLQEKNVTIILKQRQMAATGP